MFPSYKPSVGRHLKYGSDFLVFIDFLLAIDHFATLQGPKNPFLMMYHRVSTRKYKG